MTRTLTIFLILLSILSLDPEISLGQKLFELDNPDAIYLDESKINYLTSTVWNIFQMDMRNRGDLTETPKHVLFQYHEDNTFNYDSEKGHWRIIDDRYIEHSFEEEELEAALNFGGIYVVTHLSPKFMILTKALTTTSDMEISLFLELLTYYDWMNKGQIHYYQGNTTTRDLTRLSMMTDRELLQIGITVHQDTLFIFTEDSVYKVPKFPIDR